MKITRTGHGANHGPKAINIRNLIASWDSDGGRLVIKANKITNFCTIPEHDYEMSIAPHELAHMLVALGMAKDQDSKNAIGFGLSTALRALLRLIDFAVLAEPQQESPGRAA